MSEPRRGTAPAGCRSGWKPPRIPNYFVRLVGNTQASLFWLAQPLQERLVVMPNLTHDQLEFLTSGMTREERHRRFWPLPV